MSMQGRYNMESGQKVKWNHSYRECMRHATNGTTCVIFTPCVLTVCMYGSACTCLYVYLHVYMHWYKGKEMKISSLRTRNSIRKTATKASCWKYFFRKIHWLTFFYSFCSTLLPVSDVDTQVVWSHLEFRKGGEEELDFCSQKNIKPKKEYQIRQELLRKELSERVIKYTWDFLNRRRECKITFLCKAEYSFGSH